MASREKIAWAKEVYNEKLAFKAWKICVGKHFIAYCVLGTFCACTIQEYLGSFVLPISIFLCCCDLLYLEI